MAQRVQVELVDDLTGEVAQETVRFSVDGTDYEIDLTTENAQKLHSVLTGYVDKARKTSDRRGQGTRRPSPTSTGRSRREDTQQIRQWAKDNGYNPSSRGRLTKPIIDAYDAAH